MPSSSSLVGSSELIRMHQPNGGNRSSSKLPLPIIESTTSKIKTTLKNLVGSNSSNPPEPRMTRSSSLRRANSMKKGGSSKNEANLSNFTRSGTGGSLERKTSSVRRSNSTRRFRDPDIAISRAVQTTLTKNPAQDGQSNNLEIKQTFVAYMPTTMTSDDQMLETRVNESLESNDVRKARQLTLENMKLHRELEKVKQGTFEQESIKKELRTTKVRLEEERKLRQKLEETLQGHNAKIRQIALSMEAVEQEFQVRDDTLRKYDSKLQDAKSLINQLSRKIREGEISMAEKSNKIWQLQKQLKRQQNLQDALELKDFLHAENLALNETFADTELENDRLKEIIEKKDEELSKSEEQCRHLVRLNQHKHQQGLYLATKLKTVEKQAKFVILEQALAIEKTMRKLRQEEFLDKEDEEIIATQISAQVEATLGAFKSNEYEGQEITCENSLEHLSVSIQNRLKIEETEDSLAKMSAQFFTDQLAKLHQIVEQWTQKNEE